MDQEATNVDALKDAAERVALARASDKDALWIAGLAALLAVALLDDDLGSPWAIIVIAVAFAAAYRIAKIALYRARGLGWLPIFGNLLPHTVSPTVPAASAAPAAPQPRSALVRRFSLAKTWPAESIVTAKTVGVVTVRAGRPGPHADEFPLGVFLLTEYGLAFLPESRGKLEELIGDIPAGVVTQVAGQIFEPLEYVERWHNTLEFLQEPPTLGEWVTRALEQKHAFAISWGDLTGVMVGQTHAVLSRRTADGAEDDFVILDASPSWPGVLMEHRVFADMKDAVYATVLQPKYDELLPTVRKEFTTQSEVDIKAETWRRTIEWFTTTNPPVENQVRDAMAGILEDYESLPNVVANQPWLFGRQTQETN